jgi:hypothetical protein
MTNTNRRAILTGTVAALLLSTFGLAIAQSTKFYKKHKGQLFVSTEAFEAGEDDAALAAQVKKAKGALDATGGNEDSAEWRFHWMAVLSAKPGTASATIFFYDVTKERKQATYKDIGIDPEQLMVLSDLVITEDDGLTKGNKYELVLSVSKNGKQVPLAKGKVQFK